MRTWLVLLLTLCRRYLRWFLQWLRPRRCRSRGRRCPLTHPPRFRLQPKPRGVKHEVINLKALMLTSAVGRLPIPSIDAGRPGEP